MPASQRQTLPIYHSSMLLQADFPLVWTTHSLVYS